MYFSRTHQPKNADRLARKRTTDGSERPSRNRTSNERATSRPETAFTCNACTPVGTRRTRSESARYVLCATVARRTSSQTGSRSRSEERRVGKEGEDRGTEQHRKPTQ